jgi:hypothetical protein
VNPSATHVVLDINATDPDHALVDSHDNETRPHTAVHRRHRSPAGLIADLDEKQHALAFEMRDGVAPADGESC